MKQKREQEKAQTIAKRKAQQAKEQGRWYSLEVAKAEMKGA